MLVELTVANHAIHKKFLNECTHRLYLVTTLRLGCLGITESLAMPLHEIICLTSAVDVDLHQVDEVALLQQ